MMKTKKTKDTLTKSTALKATDIGINYALNTIPGGNLVYDLSKLTAKQLKRYVSERRNKKIMDFHRFLLNPNTDNNADLSNDEIEVADFHTLLSACLQDIEDEKTELYATLTKNAVSQKLSSEDLRFFCVSLSELTYNNLEEMRTAFIAANFQLIPPEGPGKFKKSLVPEEASSSNIYGRELMKLRGFISKGEINQFGEKFIQACYPSEKLLPNSISKIEWKNANSPIQMISYEIPDPYIYELSSNISNILRKEGFKTTELFAPIRKSRFSIPSRATILIFKDHPERIINNIDHIDHLIDGCCIAVQINNTYPEVLESLSQRFKVIIDINNNDEPQISALKVVNNIL